MAFTTAVWSVDGNTLRRQDRATLESEKRLEDWLAADLSLLGEDLLLIGRQIMTTGGPLDLLAMDAEGTLVIIELKRHKTPREVVAQVLDYASWVTEQSSRQIEALFAEKNGQSLVHAFRAKFESDLPEIACQEHRIIIVAAELDDSSERIIRYLQDKHDIDINAVFFSVFHIDHRELLVRAWLADPAEVQSRVIDKKARPRWGGIWYVNHTEDRDWELRRKNGYISAGGGERYSRPLRHLREGDAIAVYLRGKGYIGVGKVRSPAVVAADYRLADGSSICDLETSFAGRHEGHEEFVVGVDWINTVEESKARRFEGAFANQNVVCKLRDVETLKFLARELGLPVTTNG